MRGKLFARIDEPEALLHGKRDPIWLWQFNFKDTIGIKIFDLLVEEYLFYISSSLYIVFIWEGIRLALEAGNLLTYIVIPFLGVWSLAFMLIPYKFGLKKDKNL